MYILLWILMLFTNTQPYMTTSFSSDRGPMMRYRPASAIPGVNPPTGSESEEIRRPIGAGTATATATGAAGDSTAAVGACEIELTGAPQNWQNR
jgi:hypothetical protein